MFDTFDDFEKLMSHAKLKWTTASTNINDESSRSHMIFTVKVQSLKEETKEIAESYLTMIDLAGSESSKKAGTSGLSLQEGNEINTSLLALWQVFTSMKKKKAYVPYWDSILTLTL